MIALNHVTVDYGNQKGIFDLSFSVQKGEVLGFLGPNGAGKTTTIRQLMGFSSPDEGDCTILDMDCFRYGNEIQKHVGYLPAEIAFMDDMTGMQFIQFIAAMKNLKNLDLAHELIQYFELNPVGRIKKMSKGMKQKIGIVCAFMHDPDILILDEPTSGLDPLMQNKFVELIQAQKKKGKTIFMSSHMFEEVERTCDRAAIIKDGYLMDVEDIASLKEKKQKTYTVTFASEEMAAAFVKNMPGSVIVSDDTAMIPVRGDLMPFLHEISRYKITNLDIKPQTLEDLFMHYYGGESYA